MSQLTPVLVYDQALEELKLTGNAITELPPSIRHLKSLKVCHRKDFPTPSHASPPQHHHFPQVLVLSVNGLRHLPDDLAALTTLTHLDLSLNSLEHIGPACIPPHLVRLDLQVRSPRFRLSLQTLCLISAHTSPSTWPKSLPMTLEDQSLMERQKHHRQGNGLSELSPNIGSQLGGRRASLLQWLDLSNNSLKMLPSSLVFCSQLQTLRISFNQLKVGLRLWFPRR